MGIEGKQKGLECEIHGRKKGKELSLKVKNQTNSVPVFLCKLCRKIYVNRSHHIGNIRGLTYNGRYYPVEKIGVEETVVCKVEEKKDQKSEMIKEQPKRIKEKGIAKKTSISETRIGSLWYSSGLDRKIQVYSVICELIRLTENSTIKWQIASRNKPHYVVYSVIGKEYVSFASSKNANAFWICDIPCVCIQDCTLLEKLVYKSLNEEDRRSLKNREQVMKKAFMEARTVFDGDDKPAKKKKHKTIIKKAPKISYSIKTPVAYLNIDKEYNLPQRNLINNDMGSISDPNENKPLETQNIGIKDFVVRRNTFKCLHNDHHIENIDATVKILRKRDGTVIDKKISAGYCPKCKVFFILESTFESLKIYGIPLCRVSDEKNYLSSRNSNVQLASESILMQYGYNVGQSESLSEATRHKILATLVDNNVLSKSDIISYLDFFVSQRTGQNRYGIAISKWENDKDFIAGYRQGEFTQFGVNAIYR